MRFNGLDLNLLGTLDALWEEASMRRWVEWFYNRRLLTPIDNIPPAQAEERYYVMRDDTPMAA